MDDAAPVLSPGGHLVQPVIHRGQVMGFAVHPHGRDPVDWMSFGVELTIELPIVEAVGTLAYEIEGFRSESCADDEHVGHTQEEGRFCISPRLDGVELKPLLHLLHDPVAGVAGAERAEPPVEVPHVEGMTNGSGRGATDTSNFIESRFKLILHDSTGINSPRFPRKHIVRPSRGVHSDMTLPLTVMNSNLDSPTESVRGLVTFIQNELCDMSQPLPVFLRSCPLVIVCHHKTGSSSPHLGRRGWA